MKHKHCDGPIPTDSVDLELSLSSRAALRECGGRFVVAIP